MPVFVNVKLAHRTGTFGEVEILEGDTVARLAKRVCTVYPSWESDSTKLLLFLIPAARARLVESDHSSASDLLSGTALFSCELLSDAGVGPASCLLALPGALPTLSLSTLLPHNASRSRTLNLFALSQNGIALLTEQPSSEEQVSETESSDTQLMASRFVLLSPEIICCLPYPFGTWLKSRLYLRNTGSLWLFSVWEVVSTLLPHEWRVPLFTGTATLLFTFLAFCAETQRWRKVAVSLVVHLILVLLMRWRGLL